MGVHRYQADYPYSRPLITVEKKKGLSEAQLDDLKQRLQTRAKELMGNVMVHELAEVRYLSHRPCVFCQSEWLLGAGGDSLCIPCAPCFCPPSTLACLVGVTGSHGADGGGHS